MIQEIKNELLNEKYYEIQHPSGLKILVFPKPAYQTSYALLGVPFGSADNCFIDAEGNKVFLPDGTAHFLEHKLFESEEKDAFDQFAATGARANAYTSFDRTCYLFSCSENFEQNLQSLLAFVFDPYFTEQTVAKEQGIIGQEIKMYCDNPEWQVTMGLLCALYQNRAVNTDIAGTVASIATITPDLLYSAYNGFYLPQNMILSICGNVDVERIIHICDRYVKPSAAPLSETVLLPEPAAPQEAVIVKKMPVEMPLFAFGYKEEHDKPKTLKERLETVILNQMIIGTMSPLYDALFEEGLVGEDFSSEYFSGRLYSAVLFSGCSENGAAVKERFEAEVNRIRKEGIDRELFDCVIKDMYGTIIKGFNSVEDIATDMLDSYLNGYRYFEELELYRSITVEDIEKRLRTKYDVSRSALSLVVPDAERNENG